MKEKKKKKEDFTDEVPSELSLENWMGFKYTDRGMKQDIPSKRNEAPTQE